MTDRETMQQALEALLDLQSLDSQDVWLDRWSDAITALREALAQPEPDLIPQDQLFVCGQMGANITRVTAQPEQEPVAFYHPRNGFYWAKPTSIFAPTAVDVPPMPLYAAAERNHG